MFKKLLCLSTPPQRHQRRCFARIRKHWFVEILLPLSNGECSIEHSERLLRPPELGHSVSEQREIPKFCSRVRSCLSLFQGAAHLNQSPGTVAVKERDDTKFTSGPRFPCLVS